MKSITIPSHWQHWQWLADLHTGSPVGLTPTPSNPFQEALLNRFIDAQMWYRNNFRQPDVAVIVGDLYEGVHPKLDIEDKSLVSQIDKSVEVICMINALKEYIILTGTTIHTGLLYQELEELFIDKIKLKSLELYGNSVKVSIRRKLKTTVNKWWVCEARHFISRSIIMHGRATAPMRNQMWNILNAALSSFYQEKPVRYPNFLAFGHAHYYQKTENAWGTTCVLPAWKAIGDKYGDEICDGHIDLGLVGTFISEEDEKRWHYEKRLYQANVVSRLENR